jgi:hypothetical protein
MNISALWRTFCIALLAAGFAPSAQAGSKPTLSISFVIEGDKFEGPRMVQPMPVQGVVKYFRKVPMITHKNIKAFFPFAAKDGSMGVALRVNEAGWRNVRETAALEAGKMLAVMINGRLVQTMAIDNPKKDDYIVVIWRGVTEAEVAALKKSYPEIANKPSNGNNADPDQEIIDLTKP